MGGRPSGKESGGCPVSPSYSACWESAGEGLPGTPSEGSGATGIQTEG